MDDERERIVERLLGHRTVDLVTTGRRTGRARSTEIWITPAFGRLFVAGSPNAMRDGVDRAPRDWLANLVAHPDLTLRLKRGVEAELSARAVRVDDPHLRRRFFSLGSTAFYRDAVSLEAAIERSPMVEVTFTGDDAWIGAELERRMADDGRG